MKLRSLPLAACGAVVFAVPVGRTICTRCMTATGARLRYRALFGHAPICYVEHSCQRSVGPAPTLAMTEKAHTSPVQPRSGKTSDLPETGTFQPVATGKTSPDIRRQTF